MKSLKPKLKQRNPFVALAHNKKAGSHRKTNKQQRALDKQIQWD